ncbi:MAG TPA: alpha/beta hydrolase-fold protein [Kofleriaceae bacterium]|nr:alpha/beta hydrolase-fold protein [Kofleriaceae bacterium]
MPFATLACNPPPNGGGGDDDTTDPDAGVTSPDADDLDTPSGCAPGAAGVACVIALHEEVRTSCDATRLTELTAELQSRKGAFPLWDAGTALFAADAELAVAGAWNGWVTNATRTTALCNGALFTATAAVPTGFHPYKMVAGSTWMLDAWSWSFAYDDFAGNADGKNSVLDTHDSGRGHLVAVPEQVCSTALGNCRNMAAYLPPGYDAPANGARRYPVVFMHDGQNVFDDHDCCFGHTGWEVNVALDAEIAAGRVEETILVAVDHAGAGRNDEYGWSESVGGKQETFMTFQIETVQPRAASLWRLDPARLYVAGSSLGGLISMRLALEHPTVYAGAASLSGAFWPGQDTDTALRDRLPSIGKVPVAVYLDHGGTAQSGGDGYADSIEIRDQLVGLGWLRADSPSCTRGVDAVCYHHEPGATHDELAWRDRSWRWLRFLVGR